MKILNILVSLFFIQALFAQTEETYFESLPYKRYNDSYFKGSFKTQDKQIIEYCNRTNKLPYNFASIHFRSDSCYFINIDLLLKSADSITVYHKKFTGRYQITSDHSRMLLNEHPFSSDLIYVKEKEEKEIIKIREISFKLNDMYSQTYKKCITLFCDGHCFISRKEP